MENLSNAQLIKELYKQLLSDYKEHSRIELFTFARNNSTINFTEGMLAGALRTLVTDTDEYKCIHRGWYQKQSQKDIPQKSCSLIQEYENILDDTLKKCKSITSNPFEIMKMSSNDIEKMQNISNCLDTISKTLIEISKN
mgnify:CR=1 FL=1